MEKENVKGVCGQNQKVLSPCQSALFPTAINGLRRK